MRACSENGGVFTSPDNHTRGLSLGDTLQCMSKVTYVKVASNSSSHSERLARQQIGEEFHTQLEPLFFGEQLARFREDAVKVRH